MLWICTGSDNSRRRPARPTTRRKRRRYSAMPSISGAAPHCAAWTRPGPTPRANALEAERIAAERDLTDLRLRLGEHGALLGDLATQAHQHPLDERLAAQLMLALYRSGRTGDALAHYRDVRIRLATELGIDPGRALQQMHQRILRGDPDLATPTTARPAGSGRATTVAATSGRSTGPPPAPPRRRDSLPAAPANSRGSGRPGRAPPSPATRWR